MTALGEVLQATGVAAPAAVELVHYLAMAAVALLGVVHVKRHLRFRSVLAVAPYVLAAGAVAVAGGTALLSGIGLGVGSNGPVGGYYALMRVGLPLVLGGAVAVAAMRIRLGSLRLEEAGPAHAAWSALADRLDLLAEALEAAAEATG